MKSLKVKSSDVTGDLGAMKNQLGAVIKEVRQGQVTVPAGSCSVLCVVQPVLRCHMYNIALCCAVIRFCWSH